MNNNSFLLSLATLPGGAGVILSLSLSLFLGRTGPGGRRFGGDGRRASKLPIAASREREGDERQRK